MARDDCIFLGSIAKAHGVAGEVIIRLNQNKIVTRHKWESVFVEIDGLLVPFFISDIREGKGNELIVRFDDVNDRPKAVKLMGKKVFVPASRVKIQDPKTIHEDVVGFMVVDKVAGEIGEIESVIDIAENPMIQVRYQNKKIFIPWQERFILGYDPGNKTIIFDLPSGILRI